MGFNLRMIARVISILLLITGASMVFPLVTAAYYHETSVYPSIVTAMLISLFLGLCGYIMLDERHRGISRKKSTLTGWLLPFLF